MCVNLDVALPANYAVALQQLAGEDVHRVILLSDDCANHGETELEEITGQCKKLAQGGVSTSTYGLGEGFNEALCEFG